MALAVLQEKNIRAQNKDERCEKRLINSYMVYRANLVIFES